MAVRSTPRASSHVVELWAHASGRERRSDPALPRTGGPAGNAQLTAWTGLILLVLMLAELATLISVRGLISWHIAIGMLLVPFATVKIATTGWRVVRYYARSQPYLRAGPPPLLLRLLGPVVVASTVTVLASGSWLIWLGRTRSRTELATVIGHRIDWVTVHQVAFIAWGVATGLHVLGRFVPSLQLTRTTRRQHQEGVAPRVLVLAVSLIGAVILALLVLGASQSWTSHDQGGFRGPDRGTSAPRFSP